MANSKQKKELGICDWHQEKMLRFLLIKTAAVGSGVKPGELLRLASCYQVAGNAAGEDICLRWQDILRNLKLKCKVLSRDEAGALVLFYHPETLGQVLSEPEIKSYLESCGYDLNAGPEAALAELKRRFAAGGLPHEVGIFIGYPLKDVIGFTRGQEKTPVRGMNWQVFGEPEESLRRMRRYRLAERAAAVVLGKSPDWCTYLKNLDKFKILKGA